MRNSILLTLLLISNFCLFGQDKTMLAVEPFTTATTSVQQGDLNSIQATVTQAFVKTKRFIIVAATQTSTENLALSGHIISAQTQKEVTKNDENKDVTSYTAKISIQLKVTKVGSGEIVSSETIEASNGGGGDIFGDLLGDESGTAETPQAAMTQAIGQIESVVSEYVNTNFPASFYIVEVISNDKKGNAGEVLIAGGSAFGLEKGDKLKVVEITEVKVGDRTLERKKEIGELRIKVVEDENFSVCTIRAGASDIGTKLGASKKLLAITKD